MPGNVRVEGVVFSGLGEGSFYVGLYAKSFRKALGFIPYPGTLNIRITRGARELEDCLRRSRGVRVEPPRIPGARLGWVLAYPARLNGVPVYVVRPEITVYKSDVVEVISKSYLRGLLGVRDGDKVELEVECDEGGGGP